MTDEPTKPARRIIQIAILPESGTFAQSVLALCNDGTVWRCPVKMPNQGWNPHFPPIPQEDAA